MIIYLDVSCLNRPFDDQKQKRIHLESEAIASILNRMMLEEWKAVSSSIAVDEIDAMPNPDRRNRVRKLLPPPHAIMELTDAEYDRAAQLGILGIKPADGLHIAAAEVLKADVFISCDDQLCRVVRRHQAQVRVPVWNPVDWLEEIGI